MKICKILSYKYELGSGLARYHVTEGGRNVIYKKPSIDRVTSAVSSSRGKGAGEEARCWQGSSGWCNPRSPHSLSRPPHCHAPRVLADRAVRDARNARDVKCGCGQVISACPYPPSRAFRSDHKLAAGVIGVIFIIFLCQ